MFQQSMSKVNVSAHHVKKILDKKSTLTPEQKKSILAKYREEVDKKSYRKLLNTNHMILSGQKINGSTTINETD